MNYLLTIILCFQISFATSQKVGDIEVIIDLAKKENITEYGKILIQIKHLNGSKQIDTLNTIDGQSKIEILEFKSAKILLNVNYKNRKSGFSKLINKRGKLKYRLWNLEKKREVGLSFIKRKKAPEDWVNLTLSDYKGLQQSIYMNDYKDNWTFSSSNLFELANIHYKDPDKENVVSFAIDSNIIKATCWPKNNKVRTIERVREKAKNISELDNNTLYLNFKNLRFYFQNDINFRHKYVINKQSL